MRARADIVCWMLVAATGCALPTRTTSLEVEQRRLRDEVAALNTKVRELEGKLAVLDKRASGAPGSKTAQRALDQRLAALEAQRAGTGAERGPTPEAAPVSAAANPTPMPTPLAELDVDGLAREAARQLPGGYRRGIELIRGGDYEGAIQAMRNFVRAKHSSPFVPGAHYWIGQSCLQIGQIYQAILAFTDVVQRAPRSEYAPAAALSSGVAFWQLGNVTEARRTFERVVADHPGTPEAAKAAARLRALDTAGR